MKIANDSQNSSSRLENSGPIPNHSHRVKTDPIQRRSELEIGPLQNRMTFDQIRYSMVWEDPQVLFDAIDGDLDGTIALSIASAGCNSLALLLKNPEKVIAIDLSHSQIALVELKKVAVQNLLFEEFVTFFGYNEGTTRLSTYDAIKMKLSKSSREFWDSNAELIDKGICFSGKLETYFQKFRHALKKFWSPQDFEKMVHTNDLKEQIRIWSSTDLDTLKAKASEFFSQSAMSDSARDKEQFRFVEQKDIGRKFVQKFVEKIHTELISKNPFLFHFLTGEFFFNQNSLPILNPENYPILQKRISRLELVESDLFDYLEKTDEEFGFYNLSDVFEYLSEEQSQKLFEQLALKASDSAKMVYWTLLVDRRPNEFSSKKNSFEASDSSPTCWRVDSSDSQDRLWLYDRHYVLSK